jgi:hypothetical protein
MARFLNTGRLTIAQTARQLIIFALVVAVVLYIAWHLVLGVLAALTWVLTAAAIIVIIYLAVSMTGKIGKK